MQPPPMRCNTIFNGLLRHIRALAEVEFEVIFRVAVIESRKSTPVKANSMPLVLTAPQITHKRGGKINHAPAEHGSVCFPRLSA